MAKLAKLEVLEELKQGKQDLLDSFDNQLANIKVTKEELKELKKQLEGYPDYVVEREVKFYHIKSKLHTVIKEKNIHDQLDEAIEFLDKLLTIQTNDKE